MDETEGALTPAEAAFERDPFTRPRHAIEAPSACPSCAGKLDHTVMKAASQVEFGHQVLFRCERWPEPHPGGTYRDKIRFSGLAGGSDLAERHFYDYRGTWKRKELVTLETPSEPEQIRSLLAEGERELSAALSKIMAARRLLGQ